MIFRNSTDLPIILLRRSAVMKKSLSVAILILATALFTLSQFGCAKPQNSNTASTNANMAVPEATPDRAEIEATLTKIENDWPRIIREHDAATVRRIEADDASFVYPDGSSGGKEQDVKDIESGALSADSWEVFDLKVNVLDNDAAVVSLRSVVKGGKYKTPDGKSQDISGQYRSVDIFVRRNGQWQLVGSATTPIRNPAPGAAGSPTPKASPSAAASPAMKASPAAKSSPAAKGSPAMKASPPSPPPAKTP
jgi:ketosteroid isomerase-like protein